MEAYKIIKLIKKIGWRRRLVVAIAALTSALMLFPLRMTAAASSFPVSQTESRLATGRVAHEYTMAEPAGYALSPDLAPTLDPHATAVPAPVATQWASGLPTPVVVGTPGATQDSSSSGGVIESITRAFYTIIFPVESMEDALRGVFTHFLSGSLEAAEAVFAEAVDAIILNNPGNDATSYQAPWNGMLRISAALWPLTFIIVLTGAAKESLISSTPVGFADAKKGLLDWLISVALAAGSLLILTWVNDLFQEITRAILAADYGIFSSLDSHAIAGALLNSAILGGFTARVPFGGLFIAFFFIILALSVLVSLFLVYVAKYALLFVLIVIAPFVLTISVLPPTRWLNWTWVKMVLLVSLLGPVNALLLKLASLATIQQAGAMGELSLSAAVIHFFKLLGVLSLLLTINFSVAKTTFGAIAEVKDRAIDATKQVAGMLAAAVTVGAGALTGAAIGGSAIGGATVGGGSGVSAASAGSAAAGAGISNNAGSIGLRDAAAQIGSRGRAATLSTSPTTRPGDNGTQTMHAGQNANDNRETANSNHRQDSDPHWGTGSGEPDATPESSQGRSSRLSPEGIAGALQVGGATLSAMSGSRLGRGAGSAARVAGWMMERQMDRESRSEQGGKPAGQSALRVRSTNQWREFAAGLGASSPAGFAAAAGPLSRLAEQYGPDAVRSAAQESLGPAIAARRFGNETAPSMARQDGFYRRDSGGQPQADVSAWIGSTVENRLRTMPGGTQAGPRIYPSTPPSAPAAPGGPGAAPSLLDYRQGAQMAEALGYGSHDREAVHALASLHHAHRNPRFGFDAGSARSTVEAAWGSRSSVAGAASPDGQLTQEHLGAVRTAFLQDLSQIARDHGRTDEFFYPSSWSNLAAHIRADAGINRPE